MSKLRPIPTPLRQRWQDFRVQAVPFLTCGATFLAVIYLWNQDAAPASMLGEVESLVSEVPSPGAGLLTQLEVSRFEAVEAGDFLATVVISRPEFLRSSLAVVQADIDLIRLGIVDGQQNNALELESLKLAWLEIRADLAVHRLELQQAERDYLRASQLFETRMVSEDEHDRTQNLMMTIEETIAQKEKIAATMEDSLERLTREQNEAVGSAALQATLKLQEERLAQVEAELKPVDLIAPISGTVTFIYRRNGEYVVEGEPIISIQSPRTERIIAYLPQPLSLEPSVGMEVEVAVRNSTGQRVPSRILSIGPRIEPLPLESAFLHPFLTHYQSGLPISIGIPADLNVRPGELVDVTLRP